MKRQTSDLRPERVRAAGVPATRWDGPTGFRGVLFLFVVPGQLLVTEPGWTRIPGITGWVFRAVFVVEFFLRAHSARFHAGCWDRSWWQLIFLLVPSRGFVRVLQAIRLVRVARTARIGGILPAGLRSTRSGRLLSSRIGWLAAAVALTVLASSQLLYAMGSHTDHTTAPYEAAPATITGSGISADDPFSKVLRLILATYPVKVFATLAGSLGRLFPARRSFGVRPRHSGRRR